MSYVGTGGSTNLIERRPIIKMQRKVVVASTPTNAKLTDQRSHKNLRQCAIDAKAHTAEIRRLEENLFAISRSGHCVTLLKATK